MAIFPALQKLTHMEMVTPLSVDKQIIHIHVTAIWICVMVILYEVGGGDGLLNQTTEDDNDRGQQQFFCGVSFGF